MTDPHMKGVFMNNLRPFIVAALFVAVSIVSASAESGNCKTDPQDVKAITKLLKKESRLGKKVEAYCPELVENYARVVYDTGR